jgi:hypothetical protein
MVGLGLGGAAYLAAKYYHSSKTHTKDAVTESDKFSLPDFTGPPLVEESSISPGVLKTGNDPEPEMTEEEHPKVRKKKSPKKGKRSQAEVRTP